MSIEAPYPDLSELLSLIGDVGQRLSEIEATEGAAGNISIYVGWPVEPRRLFPQVETITLPVAVPALANGTLLVTGSGQRLREIIRDTAANLGVLVVAPDGETARLYTSPERMFANLTSELNSHLAIHCAAVEASGTNFHAVIHAQPPYLTYLSHIEAYRDKVYLNRHIMRWEPETIVHLPEGVYPVPFHVPGSAAQMEATVAALREHRLIIWSKHGVVARSDRSVKLAADYIEYAETGARYEYMNLANGERGSGLTDDEIRAICAAFGIQQTIW